jgi:hypothetical protein
LGAETVGGVVVFGMLEAVAKNKAAVVELFFGEGGIGGEVEQR